jgi:hypothetical protein
LSIDGRRGERQHRKADSQQSVPHAKNIACGGDFNSSLVGRCRLAAGKPGKPGQTDISRGKGSWSDGRSSVARTHREAVPYSSSAGLDCLVRAAKNGDRRTFLKISPNARSAEFTAILEAYLRTAPCAPPSGKTDAQNVRRRNLRNVRLSRFARFAPGLPA